MSPFFWSCRCLCKKKSASQGHSHNLAAAAAAAATAATPPPPPPDSATLVCHACKRSISRSDCHFDIQHLPRTRRYHIGCLVCFHCRALVDPLKEEFCYSKSKNKTRGGKTRTREPARQRRGREEVNTNTDNEADNKNTNTDSRHPIDYTEDDDEHPFHRACFAHHFGWLCVVCEKPLPMVTTKIIDDSSHDTTNSNTGNEAAAADSNTIRFTYTAAGSTHTTTITSGNQNTIDESIMVDSSSPGVTCSNQKPRKIIKVEFLKHPFFSNERVCPHHVKSVVTSEITMLQQQHRQQCVEVDYFYPSRGSGGRRGENLLTSIGSSSMNSSAVEIGECGSKTIRQCAGCHRFEPSLASPTKHFVNVGDPKSGQCLCLACCRTVVTSSDDVIPLWDRVSSFTWKQRLRNRSGVQFGVPCDFSALNHHVSV